MFERLSEWMSATSFAMRRVRLDDMFGRKKMMMLLNGGYEIDIMGRADCSSNKGIVATRPKAALCSKA